MGKYVCFLFNRKAVTHNGEIQQLYEEMEQQIKNEKARLSHKVKFLFAREICKPGNALYYCAVQLLWPKMLCNIF